MIISYQPWSSLFRLGFSLCFFGGSSLLSSFSPLLQLIELWRGKEWRPFRRNIFLDIKSPVCIGVGASLTYIGPLLANVVEHCWPRAYSADQQECKCCPFHHCARLRPFIVLIVNRHSFICVAGCSIIPLLFIIYSSPYWFLLYRILCWHILFRVPMSGILFAVVFSPPSSSPLVSILYVGIHLL